MNVMAIYPGFGSSILGAFLSRGDAIKPQVIIENRDYAVANLISNIPHNLSEAGITIASIIDHADKIGADQVEVTEEAEQAWLAKLQSGGRTFGGDQSCTPGYYNNEGQDAAAGAQLASLGYPEGPVAYFDYIDRWRESGDFDGLDLRIE